MKPVFKNVLAAVLGYVVMFVVAFVLFSLSWMVLGADSSFAPGGWQVSGAWIGVSVVLGLIVSIAGGAASRSWPRTAGASRSWSVWSPCSAF
jgi:hypothetical protein